ncbi:GNAT family N-acetyltransferase [Tractidigestivibacter scatoligenes]|jgi:ribosomal-protein-alanine N-acetyltransferase|uniref:GNAT family N-acetyltransferase n=1 Tax=Tractidigestivibacter scatoligenes TaxID=1299998 RepID=UPI002F3599A3
MSWEATAMRVIEHLPLETERLMLRRYTLADAPAIYRINSSEAVTRYLPFGPMMSEEDAISQLERFFLPAYAQADAGQTGPGGLPLDLKFAACLKDTKELVGMLFIETSDGSCELGYTVDSRWWGHCHRDVLGRGNETSPPCQRYLAGRREERIPLVGA